MNSRDAGSKGMGWLKPPLSIDLTKNQKQAPNWHCGSSVTPKYFSSCRLRFSEVSLSLLLALSLSLSLCDWRHSDIQHQCKLNPRDPIELPSAPEGADSQNSGPNSMSTCFSFSLFAALYMLQSSRLPTFSKALLVETPQGAREENE